MLAQLVTPRPAPRQLVYPLPWNTTSTPAAATNGPYFYDYAGQDPINQVDLTGDGITGLSGSARYVCAVANVFVCVYMRELAERGIDHFDWASKTPSELRAEAQQLRRWIAEDEERAAWTRQFRFEFDKRGGESYTRTLEDWAAEYEGDFLAFGTRD